MKRHAFLLVFLMTLSLPLAALEIPELKGRVNDYANMLSPQAVSILEARLAEIEKSDSTQLVVLTIPSLEGNAIEDFSIKVVEKWRIGQKKLDNGVILLISKEDRKIRIEVGFGLEGRLTDLLAGRIIDNIIKPEFRAERYDEGVINGVNAIMDAVKGEFTGLEQPLKHTGKSLKKGFLFPFLFLCLFIGIIGTIKRVIGGVAGGVLAPIIGASIFGPSLLWLLLLIPAGFLLGLILPSILALFAQGGAMGGGMRGSGFGGGGGFGGGFGSGGGGFSGGGGGFGGGGASGSW